LGPAPALYEELEGVIEALKPSLATLGKDDAP
jgi:hypothetical protein